MLNEYGLFIACSHPNASQYLTQCASGYHGRTSDEYLNFLAEYRVEIKKLMEYASRIEEEIKRGRLEYQMGELLKTYTKEELKRFIE